MSNHVALAAITQPGDEVIIDRFAHIFNNEVAAAATLSGLQLNPIDGDAGVITANQIEPLIRPLNLHQPVTRVIALENTHNAAGGRVFPLEEMQRIKRLAESHDMKVHLDGARLANAVVASGVSFEEYVKCADTVNMCFSKGLGAPVGSIVGGDEATIGRARKKRKQFGGGMRQAGILAAAGLYALDNHIDRLAEDHTNAKRLGEVIDGTRGLELVFPVETNIVIFRVLDGLGSTESFINKMKHQNILVSMSGTSRVRMVTHLDVNAKDIEYVAKTIESTGA
jgi:threonine aldolase